MRLDNVQALVGVQAGRGPVGPTPSSLCLGLPVATGILCASSGGFLGKVFWKALQDIVLNHHL